MDGNLLDTFSVATVLALIFTVVNFLRYVKVILIKGGSTFDERTAAVNSAVTQAIAWVSGILVVLLVAQADIASNIELFGSTLATMNLASLIVVGMVAASGAGVLNDFLASRDDSRTSEKPAFVSN